MAFEAISTNNAPSTSLVVAAAPLGTIDDGNILVGLSTSDSGSSTPGFPAGFTQPTGSPIAMASFDANTFAVGLKPASSESGDYTLTSAGNACIGGIVRFSGRDPSSTPHRISSAKSDAANPSPQTITSAAFPGGVTTEDCDILVIAIVDGAGSDSTFTAPTGYTKDADICQTSTFERQFMVAHKENVPAGFDGVLSASAAGATGAWAIFVIALASGTPDSAVVSGTATAGISETDVVAGGKVSDTTLTGDTYLPAAGFEDIELVGEVKASGTANAALNVDLTALTGGLGGPIQQNDVVVVTFGCVSTADRAMNITTTGYTKTELYANDTRDANGAMALKRMGATPDTSIALAAPGGASTESFTAVAQVWRGVDPTTALDTAVVTATGINSSRPDAPSITTVTDKAKVIACGVGTGAAADNAGGPPYPDAIVNSTDPGTSIRCAMSSTTKATAGAEDPAAWSSFTTSTSDSWVAATIALRPAAITPFDDARQAYIDGFVSAQSEANGWNAKRSSIPVTAVTRISDTVARLTLPAIAGFDITAQETLTQTVPASILSGGADIVATPTFTIDPVASGDTAHPSPGVATWVAVAAAIVLGGIAATPAPATSSWTARAPSVALGGITAAPSPATASWTARDAARSLGNATAAPAAAVTNWVGKNPTTSEGGVSASAGSGTSSWIAKDPSIALGGITAAPSSAVAAWTALGPIGSTGAFGAPAAAVSTWMANAPAIAVGGATAQPAAAVGTWNARSPASAVGGITASPASSSSTWTALSPAASAGSIGTPAPAVGTWIARAPTVSIGAISVSPASAIGNWIARAPTAGVGGVTRAPSSAVGTWTALNGQMFVGEILRPAPAIMAWTASAPTARLSLALAIARDTAAISLADAPVITISVPDADSDVSSISSADVGDASLTTTN